LFLCWVFFFCGGFFFFFFCCVGVLSTVDAPRESAALSCLNELVRRPSFSQHKTEPAEIERTSPSIPEKISPISFSFFYVADLLKIPPGFSGLGTTFSTFTPRGNRSSCRSSETEQLNRSSPPSSASSAEMNGENLSLPPSCAA